jgi:hypothetical protein
MIMSFTFCAFACGSGPPRATSHLNPLSACSRGMQ